MILDTALISAVIALTVTTVALITAGRPRHVHRVCLIEWLRRESSSSARSASRVDGSSGT
jgi:hypothetical protein